MSPFDSIWFTFGVPGGALLLALVGYAWLRHEGHKLDKRHGKHVH